MNELDIQHMRIGDMDLSQIRDVEIEGIDMQDYPDFVDAYIVSATYMGVPLTDAQLEELTVDFSEFVQDKVHDQLF